MDPLVVQVFSIALVACGNDKLPGAIDGYELARDGYERLPDFSGRLPPTGLSTRLSRLFGLLGTTYSLAFVLDAS